MKTSFALLVLGLVSACGSDSLEGEHARLADLGFDVPAGWQRIDRQRHGLQSSEWVPEENDRKESLLVMRSETASLPPNADASAVAKLLAEVPKGFGKATFGKPKPVTTRGGLVGARIDGDYTPPGTNARYHRVHVVLVEKSGAVVHVLYTAKSPDTSLGALTLVIDSIRNEEA
jgi:hypothetical protein